VDAAIVAADQVPDPDLLSVLEERLTFVGVQAGRREEPCACQDVAHRIPVALPHEDFDVLMGSCDAACMGLHRPAAEEPPRQ